MIEATVKELMRQQEQRLRIERMKEAERRAGDEAHIAFRRKPYYMQYSNNKGGGSSGKEGKE